MSQGGERPRSAAASVDSQTELPIDHLPDPALVIALSDEQIVAANDAAGELFECDPTTLSGMRYTDTYPIETEADTHQYEEVVQRSRAEERISRLPSDDPIQIETLDGVKKPVEINFKRVSIADEPHLIGIYRDVTERVHRRRDPMSVTDRVQALLEALPVPASILSPYGIVRQWNQAAAETFGYQSNEVTGDVYPLFVEDNEFNQLKNTILEGGLLDGYETIHQTKDGVHIEVELYARPLLKDGALSGIIGAAIDISEQQRRIQQLEVLHRTLRHNVRNELNIVQGHLEQLDDQLDADTDSIDHALAATESVITDAEIVNQVGVTRESHDTVQQPVCELVTDAVAAYRDRAGVSFDTDVETARVRAVEGFETAVFQAVDNAVEHTSPPVTVTVRTKETGGTVDIIVADNGDGIPDSELAAIESEEETALQHGSGAGLWAMKWLTEESGGRFSVTADASGTRVRMRLPRAT